MLNYSQLKNSSNAPIGTIMPWSGDQNVNRFPSGWILCNGDSVSARDYPQLGKLYGASGDQNFNLPSFDNDEIKDLGNDTPGVPSNLVGSGEDIPIIPSFNISVGFNIDNKSDMIGQINELELSDFSKTEIISVVPRRLGIDHTPAHTHKGDGGEPIPSVDVQFGRYAPVFVAPTNFRGSEPRRVEGSRNPEANIASNPGTLPVTWYVGDGSPGYIDNSEYYTLYSMSENAKRTFSGNRIPHISSFVVPSHGSTLQHTSRISGQYQYLETGTLPSRGTYRARKNTSNFRTNDQYSVTLNHDKDSFNSIEGHSHGIYTFTLERGSLRVRSRLIIRNIDNSDVGIRGESDFTRIDIDTNSPGMLCFMIIKAY